MVRNYVLHNFIVMGELIKGVKNKRADDSDVRVHESTTLWGRVAKVVRPVHVGKVLLSRDVKSIWLLTTEMNNRSYFEISGSM